jgi:hypothetical protein
LPCPLSTQSACIPPPGSCPGGVCTFHMVSSCSFHLRSLPATVCQGDSGSGSHAFHGSCKLTIKCPCYLVPQVTGAETKGKGTVPAGTRRYVEPVVLGLPGSTGVRHCCSSGDSSISAENNPAPTVPWVQGYGCVSRRRSRMLWLLRGCIHPHTSVPLV